LASPQILPLAIDGSNYLKRGVHMALPDFLLIGAAKSGTTAIDQYLHQHPQIFMATKETRFFAYDADLSKVSEYHRDLGDTFWWIQTQDQYEALFVDAEPGQVKGEATPLYLESDNAAGNIHRIVPDAQLIASLRNPVERSISDYMMQVRHGREDRSFEDAFDASAHHVKGSLYYEQFKRYLDLFPRERLMVFMYEEFRKDNVKKLQDIFGFLGVDTSFVPDTGERHNTGGYPRSKIINKALMNPAVHRMVKPLAPDWLKDSVRKVVKMNMTKAPEVDPQIKETLRNFYREDILKLQDLLQQDFSPWLEESEAT
jgi:hypothetical protein